MTNFLDKTGLSYFWTKIKSYVDGKFYKKTGGNLDGDIRFVKKEGQVARSIGFGQSGADGTSLTFSATSLQMSGPDGANFSMSGKKITNLGDPSLDADAVNYKTLKSRASAYDMTVADVGKVLTVEVFNEKPYAYWKELPSGGSSATLSTVTLTSSGWSGDNTQTVSIPGVLADETKQLIQPVAATISKEQYELYGVSCTGQAADSLTFTCLALPESDLTVYVVITELVTS